MTTGPLHWQLLLQSRAVDNQIYVAGCAPARDTSASYVAWGHSTCVDPMGQVMGQLEEKEGILYVDWETEKVEETRTSIPTSNQRRHDVYPNLCQDFLYNQ